MALGEERPKKLQAGRYSYKGYELMKTTSGRHTSWNVNEKLEKSDLSDAYRGTENTKRQAIELVDQLASEGNK